VLAQGGAASEGGATALRGRRGPGLRAPTLSLACAGEAGHQVVDLLKKNPAVAVPVILARLKQKDEEWCGAPLRSRPRLSERAPLRAARRAAARRACAGLHACSPELHGASAFQAARWPRVLGKAALGKDCCCALPAPGARSASTLPRAPQRVSQWGRAQEHGVPRCMRRLRGACRCATPRARPRRRKVKQTMYRMWAKVYEANYHKSLDHRSFYFKQARPGRGCGAGSLTGLLSAPRRVSGCTEIAGAARQWKGPHWGLFSCKGLSLLRAFPAACLAECTSPHGLRCSPAAPAH